MTENYPQLKSDALFRDLMSQLEGTENRITVARNRYIKAVQDYNVGIRTFPNNLTAMVFGYKEKPNFSVENEKEISTAPKVDFNPTPAPGSRRPVASEVPLIWRSRNRAQIGRDERCKSLLLALLLCWAFAACGRRRGAAADGARGRSDRDAVSSGDIAALTQTLRDFEARKGSQIAVLIVPTTEPETIEQFSIRVAEAWKIGRKKIDDGALLVDRQERPQSSHRGRLRPRRRADRRHHQAHHRRRSSRRNSRPAILPAAFPPASTG